MKKGDNLNFRLEPCGQPQMWYMVEDGGEHDKPITQCVSRCATAEETALWLALFPKLEDLPNADLSSALAESRPDIKIIHIHDGEMGEAPFDVQHSLPTSAPTADEYLASRSMAPEPLSERIKAEQMIASRTMSAERAGDPTDAELEKLTAPGV